MKKIILGAGIVALGAAGIAQAGERAPNPGVPSKEYSIGMVSGAAIGAAAAGPPGAFVGLVFGAWLGDRFNTQKQTITSLNQRLEESDTTLSALSRRLVESDQGIARLTGELRLTREQLAVAQAGLPSLPPAMQRTLRGEVLFRTNDSTVRPETGAHLASLGEVLAATPGAFVQLDGHADPRGADDQNMKLSEQRAEAVREALIAGGLAPERIRVASHGEHEAMSANGDLDGYALERRVVITIGSVDTQVVQAGTEPSPQTGAQ